MPLSLGVLLERVRDRDGPVAQVLAIHGVHGGVGGLEAGKVDKGKALGVARLRVAHDLGRLQDDTEGGEGVVEELLVHLGVQVADEDVGADVEVLLVGGGLVDADGFAVELDHVHDLDGVVGVLLAQELDKAVALVHLGDAVLGHVDVYCGWRG